MRISFACSMQTLEDALRRIERAVTAPAARRTG
jgi:bifunctional pyridoxal-dependent enzyme with beta-cystathionase and maltose regulon repressor activities